MEMKNRRFKQGKIIKGKNLKGYMLCKALSEDMVMRGFQYRIEQQSYGVCMGLLKLADKYPPAKLEEACRTALSYTQNPSYKSISNILAASQKGRL